jgi:2-aminoadipate transaminase
MIVEDDIYGLLAYDGTAPATLKALDEDGLVVHVSSFAKLFMPGLRLGYAVAPPALQARLASLRRAADLCGPPLLQQTLAELLMSGVMQRHLRSVLPLYRGRRDSALAALQRHMPRSAQWTKPAGGFCLWLSLPQQQCIGIQQDALRRGWAFAPGGAFMTVPDGQVHLRISFGHQPPEKIQQGIAVLSELIRQRLDAPVLLQNWTPLV